jgi:transcription antitermination factor NusG
MEVWSKRKDRKKKIHKVLFPGYLFVNDCLNHSKSLEILKTPGVVRILGNEQGPVPVPEAQIESIMRILDRGVVMNPIPYLKEGQLVRVVDGPLQGCEGFLSEVKEDKERLIISVDILKRSVAVEIEATSVEPV